MNIPMYMSEVKGMIEEVKGMNADILGLNIEESKSRKLRKTINISKVSSLVLLQPMINSNFFFDLF